MCSWEQFLEDPNNLTSPSRRGHWGLLETANRRKNHPEPKNRKPHAKLSKPIHFHIPVIKTLIDPIHWRQVEHTE